MILYLHFVPSYNIFKFVQCCRTILHAFNRLTLSVSPIDSISLNVLMTKALLFIVKLLSISNWAGRIDVVISLKKVFCLWPELKSLSVCVCECVCVCVCVRVGGCVCVCVCNHVCGEITALSNMVSGEVNTIHKHWNCNTRQDDPIPDPDNMDNPDHIIFWPITSKVMNGFIPNFTCVLFRSGHKIVTFASSWLP